jgi:hypothetical protein
MDRGPQSFQTYLYFKNNPRFSLTVGNHDAFYFNGVTGIEAALTDENGGKETFDQIVAHYSDDRNPLPKRSYTDAGAETWQAAYYVYKNHLKGKLPERLLQRIGTTDQDITLFLYGVLDEMGEYFKNQGYIRTATANGQNYVMTHSGYVPTHPDGTIKTNDELTGALTDKGSEVNRLLEWRPDGYKERKHKGPIVQKAIPNYTVLHGHTYFEEGQPENVVNIQNGHLVSINLDGNASGIAPSQRMAEKTQARPFPMAPRLQHTSPTKSSVVTNSAPRTFSPSTIPAQ